MGKGLGQIAEFEKGSNVRCLGLAGVVANKNPDRFAKTYAMTDLTSASDAMAHPAHWLMALASNAAREWR